MPMLQRFRKQYSSRKGQSLVEALAALGILTVGLMGVLTLLSHSFLLQRETADEAKATYLASEGLEIMKNLVDHNVYAGAADGQETNGWSGADTSCLNFESGSLYYHVDFETYSCPSGSADGVPEPLYLAEDPGTGQDMYYDSAHGAGIPGAVQTDFSRVVTVTRVDANTIDVVSKVTWNTGSITGQSVTVEDTFYNWHP